MYRYFDILCINVFNFLIDSFLATCTGHLVYINVFFFFFLIKYCIYDIKYNMRDRKLFHTSPYTFNMNTLIKKGQNKD